MDKLRIMPWTEVTDDVVVSWTAVELIVNIHHELQQSATNAYAFATLLAEGEEHGFASDKQKEDLEFLQNRTERIYKLMRWMTLWILARSDKAGSWVSDDAGSTFARSAAEIKALTGWTD